MIRLHNGLNQVDLNRDGKEDTVVVAQRNNYNAHGFEVTTIYIWAAASKGAKEQLQIVPLERTEEEQKASTPQRLNVTSGGGADCKLHDFRIFLNDADNSTTLVTAKREFGKHFADSEIVTFTYYKLTANTEGVPGSPTLYFKPFDDAVSKEKYCDVNEALQKELGILGDGR